MKRKLQNTILIAAFAISIFSCKKDDEKPANAFSYNGKSYPIKLAAIDYDMDGEMIGNTKVYYHDILLMGDGLTIQNNNVTGVGDALGVLIISNTIDIEPGTYNYNEDELTEKAGDFVDGTLALGFNGSAVHEHDLESGKVIIAKSGDTYTIDIDVTTDGKPVKAHYNGALTKF